MLSQLNNIFMIFEERMSIIINFSWNKTPHGYNDYEKGITKSNIPKDYGLI